MMFDFVDDLYCLYYQIFYNFIIYFIKSKGKDRVLDLYIITCYYIYDNWEAA